MARQRREHERAWAQIVIDEVAGWGRPEPVTYDERRSVVVVAGLGEIPVDDPDGKIANWDPEPQRSEFVHRAHRLLAQHYVVPDDWHTGEPELDRVIRRELLSLNKFRDSARPHEAVARLERLLGKPGWRDRLAWAAGDYVRAGVEMPYPTAIVLGALIWSELGEPERAAEAAEHLLRTPSGVEVDVAGLFSTRLTGFCLATCLRHGRAATAALIEQRPGFDGNTMAEALVLAAAAAEAGDVDELRTQHERIRRMLTKQEREAGPYAFNDGHAIRYIEATVASWLPGDGARPAEEIATLTATLVAEIDANGSTGVEWRGDVAVATGPGAEVAVRSTGEPVLPPPAAAPVVRETTAVTDGETIIVRRLDGSDLALDHEWSDEVEAFGDLCARWAPDGIRFAVWGEVGPFHVFASDGTFEGEFLDHWNNPNLGCAFGGQRLASWASDGRVAIYDLPSRMAYTAIDVGVWPDDAALDDDGDLVVIAHDGAWTAFDAETGDRVGPRRRAVAAAIHSRLPLVAYVGEGALWLERHDREAPTVQG